MPVNTPPPCPPYEAYAPNPGSDISPNRFSGSPPRPSRDRHLTQESSYAVAPQRQTPLTVKKQLKPTGKSVYAQHDKKERQQHPTGDKERVPKEGSCITYVQQSIDETSYAKP